VNVLFVGNSYTSSNDLPGTIQSLATARGQAMRHEVLARGGALLRDHLTGGWGAASQRIISGAFTHVVLQEQSQLPAVAPPLFIEPACALTSLTSEHGAQPILFVTWAPRDQPHEQFRISAAYQAAARQSGAALAPVGLAWAKALAASPGLALHGPDGRHPAPAGTYLAALVLYRTLTGDTPIGLPVRHGVSEAVARTLAQIAAATDF
jgi:hypothetical protein